MKARRDLPHRAIALLPGLLLALLAGSAQAQTPRGGKGRPSLPLPSILQEAPQPRGGSGQPMRVSRVEPTGVPGTRRIVSVRELPDGSQEVTEAIVDDTGSVLSTRVFRVFPGPICGHCGVRGPAVRYEKRTERGAPNRSGFRTVVETWKDASGNVVYSTVYLEGPHGERFDFGMEDPFAR